MKQLLMVIPLLLCCFIYSASATSLQGTVSDSTTGSPVIDAKLIAYTFTDNGDSLIFEVSSGSSGNFFFGDLPNGTYSLQCTHPNYITQIRRNIQITSTDLALYFHFQLQDRIVYRDTYVGGHVYSVPEMLPAFIPLENATIVLNSEVVGFSARSDKDGAYHFWNIPGGWYFLSAFAPGHIPQHNIDTIFVEEHSHIENLDIYLKPYNSNPVSLSGIVYEKNSNLPVHPASLSLFAIHTGITDSAFFEIQNNPDGSYNFKSVPPGFYRLECRARGYQTFVEQAIDLTQDDLT